MQGADCIQTLAADTDQQNQLSEKQPSASLFPLSLSLSIPLTHSHSIHLPLQVTHHPSTAPSLLNGAICGWVTHF